MLPDSILTTINVPTSNWHEEGNAKVDIYIAKAIQLLNDKGYPTNCCCSGHYKKDLGGSDGHLMDGYVWFKCDIPYPPSGWYLDSWKMPSGGDTIRYQSKRSKTILQKKMKKLLRWAKELPWR